MKRLLFEDGIINNINTPFFIMDGKVLMEELFKLKKAVDAYWLNTTIAYSVKTNSLPFLAKFLGNQGVFAEVVSQDEYEMVSLCGFTPDRIVCNGPVKLQEFVCGLMDSHAILNIDSHRELLYAINHASINPQKDYVVGLRVNIDIEKYFPTESKAGEQGSRFGFCMENKELENAISLVKTCKNLSINGLHLHVSTSTRRVEVYRKLTRVFGFLVKKYGLSDITYFDIGGGFYGGLPDKPQWDDYMAAISEELFAEGFCPAKLTLILEPGVSLLASAFSYYASVVDVKDTNRSRFVVIDGSRIHIDPLFHKTNYYYHHLRRSQARIQKLPKQIVVGFTCLEYDNIITLKDCDEVSVDDVLCFDKLGAYTLSLSPLFISFFPDVYFKNSDGTYKCVRKRMTAEDFVRNSEL